MFERDVVGVHQVDPDGVVGEFILAHHRVVAVHKVQPISALRNLIPLDDQILGIPEDHIPEINRCIVLNHTPMAPPQTDAIASSAEFEVLPDEVVVSDDGLRRLAQVDPEIHILECVALNGHRPIKCTHTSRFLINS